MAGYKDTYIFQTMDVQRILNNLVKWDPAFVSTWKLLASTLLMSFTT
jgi:hypothetical protein